MRYTARMLSSSDVLRAGALLRAIAASSTWTSGAAVSVAEVARSNGIVATDKEVDAMSAYLVGQGWLAVDPKPSVSGQDRHSMTRHGFDESQRKLPREPKPWMRGAS
jgi:hypothetical protein